MALLPILTAPHPVLEKKARDVRADELGPALDAFMSDMAETMYAAPGVGLAAPQVGDGRRFVVIDSGDDDGSGLLKMVNPTIVARSKETIPWRETCLSVPEFEVEVDRARHITVTWLTPTGEPREQDFHDFEAVIVQHELDHLVGTVLLDKVSRFRRSRYLARVRKERRVPARA
ncbi:MAG: peptide deformylase [Alphaproteobacteria bacterium]|nr:peptide deformylase [Alphaproteobacteria bacterium]